MESLNISDLVARLGSDEDSVRKMAVFKLQSALGDPSFADVFISEGGLPKLRELALRSNGNTLAYALTSFSRLLELDKGWECVDEDLIERAVQLVVTQPLVNILRSAVSVLVAIVSHPQNREDGSASGLNDPTASGFHALKPAVAVYPSFLEMLVSMLSSAEHLLCANALQLINSLVRDAVTNEAETEWPKFIKKLQDLGVIKAVYLLMQGSAIQDLAQPLLEFQNLTKIMLRKWRDVKVDLDKPEHKRALRNISTISYISPSAGLSGDTTEATNERTGTSRQESRRNRDPERWRRIGFDSEYPGPEFADTGFLGMMDLTDFVVRNEDQFRKLILEQTGKPAELRCPMARASLAVTYVLYEHFEIDKGDTHDTKSYAMLESRTKLDKAFKPLLLHWSRLHTAGLNAFLRLWKATGAEVEDFNKVAELLRILIDQVVGQALRTKDIAEAEDELADIDLRKLRESQMELVELTYEDAWGHHLRQVREDLNFEALQFVKEQRIRCLLAGAWFPLPFKDALVKGAKSVSPPSWRYVRLSRNRRFLQWADFDGKRDPSPTLDELKETIDLSTVTSVVSNVFASPPGSPSENQTDDKTAATNGEKKTVAGKDATGHKHKKSASRASTSTKITIHGIVPISSTSNPASPTQSKNTGATKESVLLQLYPQTHTLASEWLDGLLMLLNQKPITAETTKLVKLIGSYGLKIRLLNIRYEDLSSDEIRVPGREGLDEDYWYDFGGIMTEAGA